MNTPIMPYSKNQLYLVAQISWLTCHQYLPFFKSYSIAYSNELIFEYELEIEAAQKAQGTLLESTKAGKLNQDNDFYDLVILNRLQQLHHDAEIIFKQKPQIAQQFNFNSILNLVQSIPS